MNSKNINTMTLNEWVEQKDLSITEFTERFIDVVINDYGSHNFETVKHIVTYRLNKEQKNINEWDIINTTITN